MADNGYEVWLANSRGNTYSRNHKWLTTENSEFWAFSWDEMAQYDLPAMIDHIIRASNVDHIYYVGHSQGTEIFFAYFNDHPEYSYKVKAMAALAPIAYIGHVKSPIKIIAPFCRSLKFVDFFGINEFLPSMSLIKFLSSYVCPSRPAYEICSNIVYLLSGYDEPNTNKTRLPIYLSHTPAGTSVQNMVHYCQASWYGDYEKLDFGADMNMRKYGQLTPPKYGLNRIQVPTALFSGGQDWLSSKEDVAHLKRLHGNIIEEYSVFLDYYNHLDFVWGIDAKHKVYPKLLDFFEAFSDFS